MSSGIQNVSSIELKSVKDLKQETTSTESGELILVGSNQELKGFKKLIDSFKRKEIDLETQDDNSEKSLKGRHIALIAMAGGLGTGLLVGNGTALNSGGPLALIIAYTIIGTMLFSTILAAGELAVAYSSLPGGFNAYCAKLVDRSLGFAVAWNYAVNWFSVLPLEMVTASMTVKFWNDKINSDVFVAIFYTFIVLINLFGAKGYGEAEFWFNSAKVCMLIGFIILGLLINTGHAGNAGYIGDIYFKNPGLFANGFKGVCTVFITSAFSLGGTEFMALTAADQANPRKAIPTATKQVFYRLVFVYLLSIIILCLLVPYDSPELMGSGENNGAPISPYVIAISSYGIKVIPSIINAVILIAVLSVGNSALYSSSRTFYALSKQGFAPKWFDYVDKKNRPIRAMLLSIVFGLFSFIAAYEDQESIFIWLLSLSGLSNLFTWTSICISHVRFRAGLKAQGKSTDELGYKSSLGSYGSYYSIVLNVLIFIGQFWVALFPVKDSGSPNVVHFFQNYLGMFSFVLFYFGHKIYTYVKKRDKFVWVCIDADKIDIDTDRTIFDSKELEIEKLRDEERLKNSPFYYRIIDFLC